MSLIVRAAGLVKEFRRAKRVSGRLSELRTFLSREYDVIRAVDDVSFDIHSGELVGYLGPNGAGKSTTIKMLTGILVPTSGRVRVCGLDPIRQRRELARRIGVVFGQRSQLWWDLPLIDSFELLRAIYQVSAASHAERLAECAELLGLDAFLATPVRQLSLGQRMRGEVTAALLHGPELLVLDEPTIGLDLESKSRLIQFLADLNQRRDTTLVLTTHDLNDIQQLCARLVVIDHGTVLADAPLDVLHNDVSPHRVLVVDLEAQQPALTDLPGVVSVEVSNGGLRQALAFRRDETTAAHLVALAAARAPVHDVSVREPTIEDVVRRLYQRGSALGARSAFSWFMS